MPDGKFHQRFNIDLGVDEARRRFSNRANNLIFQKLIPQDCSKKWDQPVSARVDMAICTKLGEIYDGSNTLKKILGADFHMHLRALEAAYVCDYSAWANEAAKQLLDECEVDLSIRWQDGQFRPSGSPLLDEKLVDNVIGLLNPPAYKGVLNPFVKGLDHFLHSRRNSALLSDVVTDMHESLEALTKIVNKNDKDLSANQESFVSNVKLSNPYKRMLKEYISYANDFARHAGEKGQAKPLPSRREVEAFMYQTGLFLRIALSNDE